MKISYTDDEVCIFHPPVESAVKKYLEDKNLNSIYEIEHHPKYVVGIPDFVIKDKKSQKWVFVIEVKRTPSAVKSLAFWNQTRDYVVDNRSSKWNPDNEPFFMVTNIETSCFLCDRSDATSLTVQYCLLNNGEYNCIKFGTDSTKTIAEFSNIVVARIFSMLGLAVGKGHAPKTAFAENFKMIINEFIDSKQRLTNYFQNVIEPQIRKNPVEFNFQSSQDYLSKMELWRNLNDPRSSELDFKKISTEVANDCIFRVFTYEYCREFFSQKNKYTQLLPIKCTSKSVTEKSFAQCIDNLKKIDFSQIFDKRLVTFVPENIDDGTNEILEKFINSLNTEMKPAIQENASPNYVLNTIIGNKVLFPLENARADGKIMTEPELSEFITSLCFVLHGKDSIPDIFDPGCGTCNFLSNSYDQIKSANPDLTHNDILSHLHGCDVDSFLGKLGAFGLIMKSPLDIDKNTKLDVRLEDFFETPNTDLEKYDIVIMNPPFLRNDNKLVELNRSSIEDKIEKILGKPSNMVTVPQPNHFFYFVELATNLLKKDGIAGFILMQSFLNTENGEHLKRFLLENFEILYVIAIPSSYFFSKSTVSPCVLILRKRKNPCVLSQILKTQNNEVRFARVLDRNFFTKDYVEVLNSDSKKQDEVLIKVVKQRKLKPKENWKLHTLPASDYYEFFSESKSFQNLSKIFKKIKRGELANEGNGSEFFFPWSTGKIQRVMSTEIQNIEIEFKKLGMNNSDQVSNYVLSEADLGKQPSLAIPENTVIRNHTGLATFISEFNRQFTRPERWNIDSFTLNAQIILPRAARKVQHVDYNPFWNSKPVYFSTNFVCCMDCNIAVKGLSVEQVLKFVAGYLNSSFAQIMLEFESQNREGLRKIEVKAMSDKVFVPTKSLDTNKKLVAKIAKQFESLKFGLTGEEETPSPRYDLDLAVAELLFNIEPKFAEVAASATELAEKVEVDLLELVNARKDH